MKWHTLSHVEDEWRVRWLRVQPGEVVRRRGVVRYLIVECRTVGNAENNENIVRAIPGIPLNILSARPDVVLDAVLGCGSRKHYLADIHIARALPFRLIAKTASCLDKVPAVALQPDCRTDCYSSSRAFAKVFDFDQYRYTDLSATRDRQGTVQVNAWGKPRPLDKHQMSVSLLPLALYCFQRPDSGNYTTKTNKHEGDGSVRGNGCEQERPSLDVRCVISGVFCLFGLFWGLAMALRIDNKRDFRRAALSLLSGVFFAVGMAFWFFSFLHPYTLGLPRGLPPEWLPAKWNPCPQDYRDYFPHW